MSTLPKGTVIRLPVATCCYLCSKLIPEGATAIFIHGKGIQHVACPTG